MKYKKALTEITFTKRCLSLRGLCINLSAQSTFTNFTLNDDTTVVHLVHLQVHPPIAIHQNYYHNLSTLLNTKYDYVKLYVL